VTEPETSSENDALLALAVIDGDGSDAPAALAEENRGLVAQLENVQQIISALGALETSAGEPALAAATTWGPFIVQEQLGRGSFGIVYRGFDPAVAREVAIKLYAGAELPSEPRFMARVHHPNVITVFGAAVHEGRPGICMELVRGRTIAERVGAEGPLPISEVLRIGIEVCRALEAVHEAHLVHQDVKARNVMEQDDGRVVLMDFGAGVARSTGDIAPRRAGTPLYMAPEVVRGNPASAQSDIYSLGVFLYYMLCGMHPVSASSWKDLTERFEHAEPPVEREIIAHLQQLRPEIPRRLAGCVAKALAPAEKRFRSAAEVRADLDRIRRARTLREQTTRLLEWRSVAAALVTGLLLAGAILGARWALHRPTSPRIAVLRRLTWDLGLTTDPSRSADGKLLAYASDRANQENLDIWVQQIVGGAPLRLTHDPADESQPSFAPDGRQVAFRSERDGGGIYLISALGGEPRLLAARGRWPRFSPDGRRIAYLDISGSMFVAPINGGAIQEFRVGALTAPTWSHDGTHLILMAWGPAAKQDWWVVPVDGSEPIKTGALAALAQQGIEVVTNWAAPWTWTHDRLLFHARHGDSVSLWEATLSPRSFALAGPARQLAISTEDQFQPSLASDGGLIFSTRTEIPYLWELPLDSSGDAPSSPRPLVPHYPGRGVHDICPDGRWMTFTFALPGQAGIGLKDLVLGTESTLTTSSASLQERYPVISADGGKVLYGAVENGKRAIRRVSARGGLPEEVCQECGLPTDWSPNERYALLLYGVPARSTLAVIDLVTGERAEILKHQEKELYRGTFSPDGQWILFHAALPSGPTEEVIVPFRGLAPIGEREWIHAAGGTAWTDAPRWSPDGNSIYYLSDADGSRCIWARRLDPTTKVPRGEPFSIHHIHGRKRSITNVGPADVELSVVEGRIVYNMTESRGNLWLAEFR
jgi:eukaryotic-like serine/threonine-protein kinase